MQIINYLDGKTISFVDSIRTPLLNKFFIIITYLGEGATVLLLATIIAIFLLINKKKTFALSLWLSLGGSVLSAYILKWAVQRPRPIGGIVEEASFSFPSAHAVISVSFYAFVAYLLWRNSGNRLIKLSALFFVIILILLIGFSRLYLGVHFLSDVLAGYLLGLFWFFVGVKLIKTQSPIENLIKLWKWL